MIHKAGAGPAPIPQKTLSVDNLVAAIKFAVSEPAKAAAEGMGERIRTEKGEVKGVESFHRHLPLLNMRSVGSQSTPIF
jgi:sterol 3beta-glucosyltransferase